MPVFLSLFLIFGELGLLKFKGLISLIGFIMLIIGVSSLVIFVKGYTRKDGTRVRGYSGEK
jgi:membrane-bound ClpP family serine protease